MGSASVFWKLLAGIRGDLTDGFLRESAAIQLRCVCVSEEEAGQEHMLRNGAQKEKKKKKKSFRCVQSCGNSEDHRSTNSFFSSPLFSFHSLTSGRWRFDAD